jgi:hypothetical protein
VSHAVGAVRHGQGCVASCTQTQYIQNGRGAGRCYGGEGADRLAVFNAPRLLD